MAPKIRVKRPITGAEGALGGAAQQPPQATGALPAPKDWLNYLNYRAPDFKAIQTDWIDDTVRRRGLSVISEMLLDAQVAASSDLLKYAILGLDITVSPPDGFEEDEEAQKAADLARKHFDLYPGGIKQLGLDLLSAADYGYAIVEPLWDTDSVNGEWRINGHNSLPPALYGFKLDDGGRIDKVLQLGALGSTSQQTQEYALENFLTMRWNPRFGAPYGRSQLRRAFEPWWMKQLIRRMRNTTLDRFGAPLVFFQVPKNTSSQDRNRLKKILENLYAEAGAVLDDDQQIQLVSGQGGAATEGFEQALLYEDAQISKAITGVSLNASESMGTGTYAQSKVHQDNFLYYVEYGAQLLANVYTDQLAPRICRYNLGTPAEKMPVISFEPVRTDDVMEKIQSINAAAQLNIVAPDLEYNWMREAIGLPAAHDEVADAIKDRAGKLADAAVQQQQNMAQPPQGPSAQPGGPQDGQTDGGQGGGPQDPPQQPQRPTDNDWSDEDYSNWMRGFVAQSELLRPRE